MDQYLEKISAALGAPIDHLKLIGLMLISVPLALIFPLLKSSKQSNFIHLFSALPSIIFLWNILGLKRGFIDLLVSCLVVYGICNFGKSYGKAMPWFAFLIVFGHLTINHLIRHFDEVSLDVIEITGSQMVLVMKLTSFAWSVYDGQRNPTELDPTQELSKITELPSLSSFLGYCFFFPSILAGPSYTYASYISFTSHELFKQESNQMKLPAGRRRKALRRLATGLFFLGIYSVYGAQISYFQMLSPEFATRPYVIRFLYLNLSGLIARTKYYAVWCIAESAFITSGFGYNPKTKKYDGARNVRIRDIELAPNFKVLFDSWNMNTNVWLRECVYKRVAKTGKKPGFKSTQLTFLTSALWHGVNPNYVITFVAGGFCSALARSCRQNFRPFFLPPGYTAKPIPSASSTKSAPIKKLPPPPQTIFKSIYDITGILATQAGLNFIVVPFIVLDFSTVVKVWSSVHYYGLAGIFIPYLILNYGLGSYLRAQIRKRDARASKADLKEGAELREFEAIEKLKNSKRPHGVPALGLEIESEGSESESKKME